MENGWKMEDGKWKPASSPFGVARKPWQDSPGGRSEEAAYPTLPASEHLARLALRGSTSGSLVIRPEFRLTLDHTPGCRIVLNVPKQQYAA